jgi:hypothetical protein
LALRCYFAGAFYWQFSIYRIHKALRRVTNGSYPISPSRAILFGLIPVFNLYWLFRWTSELTRFVNSRCGTKPMRERSLALSLLVALLIRPFDGGLLVFLASARMVRKLTRAISPQSARQTVIARKERFSLAVSAGLGAGFGYLLYESAIAFFAERREEQIHLAITIAVVSVGVMKFVEPLCERLREGLGGAHANRAGARRDFPWAFRLGLLLMLVFASLSHGLLHRLIEQRTWEAVAVLLAAFFISGGTTYVWLSAARVGRSRWSGWMGDRPKPPPATSLRCRDQHVGCGLGGVRPHAVAAGSNRANGSAFEERVRGTRLVCWSDRLSAC